MEPITAEVLESDAEVAVELSMDDLDRVGGGRIGSGGSGAPAEAQSRITGSAVRTFSGVSAARQPPDWTHRYCSR